MKRLNEDIYPVYNQVTYGIKEVGNWANISDRLDKVNKCLVIEQHEPARLAELQQQFQVELSAKADIIFTSVKLLEVLPKSITKVTGIQRLLKSKSITMDQVMAFGDYDNDIEMLKAAGLGIAVENGSPAAKASADLVIEACDKQGPAKFLASLMR
jgi:HAD superfamily hydrolase (TIGR01484 family)